MKNNGTRAAPRLALIPLLLAVPVAALAQAFIEPVQGIAPRSDGSYVILQDGTRLDGKVRSASMFGAYIKRINFEDESGEKHKLDAENVEQLGIRISGFLKFMMVSDSLDTRSDTPWARVRAFTSVDWQEIMNRDYAIYDQALLPNGNWRLLQLLNPGFDSRLKVYQATQGLTFNGRVSKYLVVKDGARPFEVERGDYDEQFPQIYGDCTEFIESFGGARPRFEDMAGHVAVYDRVCPGD